jgi:hypothetical protein
MNFLLVDFGWFVCLEVDLLNSDLVVEAIDGFCIDFEELPIVLIGLP